jgi:hypothetical protein
MFILLVNQCLFVKQFCSVGCSLSIFNGNFFSVIILFGSLLVVCVYTNGENRIKVNKIFSAFTINFFTMLSVSCVLTEFSCRIEPE